MSEKPTFLLDGRRSRSSLARPSCRRRSRPDTTSPPLLSPGVQAPRQLQGVHREGERAHRCSCTLPAQEGLELASDEPEMNELRQTLVQMLFARATTSVRLARRAATAGCRRSATTWVMTLASPLLPDRPSTPRTRPSPRLQPLHPVRALRARLVRGRRKCVFALSGRGIGKHLIVNSESGRLADTTSRSATRRSRSARRRHPQEAGRVRPAHRRAALRRKPDQRPGARGRAAPGARK